MITTVTLNASIDKAYVMERAIENGTVMRVKEVRNTAGGKGLNVAKVARICGADVQATDSTLRTSQGAAMWKRGFSM